MSLFLPINVVRGGRDAGMFTIDAHEGTTVEGLKKKVLAAEGIPVEFQRFVFRTFTSQQGWTRRYHQTDDKRTLQEYRSPGDESTLVLKYLAPPGKEAAPFTVATFPPSYGVSRVLYVVSVGRTMREKVYPEGCTKLAHLLPLLRSHLEGLPDTATFNVLHFADDCAAVSDQMMEASQENVDRVVAELGRVSPTGAANASRSLRLVLKDFADAVDAIVLVMDTHPSTNAQKLLEKVVELNLDKFVPFHCVGLMPVGADFRAERFLLGLARASGGSYRCPNLQLSEKVASNQWADAF
eukprot:RCo007231